MDVSRRRLGLGLFGCGAGLTLFAAAARAEDDDDAPPNVFISPCGQPFRAKIRAPYPVVDWFKQADKNSDGRIDHAEFIADAEAFFKTLDQDNDGELSPIEVAIYERRVAPEILGYNYQIGALRPRLWLAQMGGGAGGMGGIGGPPMVAGGEGESDSNLPPPKAQLDESGQGASPYSFFDEPEPVTAADLEFTNIIRLPNFLKLADEHFTTLDPTGRGYLTLDKLPQTAAQKKVEQWLRHHRQK